LRPVSGLILPWVNPLHRWMSEKWRSLIMAGEVGGEV
jgi:hypothetical protein